MSADEVLAANLWPWPDPLLKRDQNGQVMFVNSAFLQLYGGRIEDWRGNMVAGWPAPSPQGAQRFETRAGEPPHQVVYDWVEMVMADGNAMAIARNVTALIPAPTPPGQEFVPAPPAAASSHIQAPMADSKPDAPMATPPAPPHIPAPPPFETAPAQEQTQQPAQAQTPATQTEAEIPAEPTVEKAPAPAMTAPEHQAPDLSNDLEDTLNRSADDYLNQSTAEQTENTSDAPQEMAAPAPPAPEPREETERMIERRALPIEDSTAVLGSNWRDQVIAKAVGAEITENDDEDDGDEAPDMASESEMDNTSEIGSNAAAGLHILLAEDNAINALLTRTLLEAEGAKVDTVEDGALALEAVQKENYDLIFMDMRMPNMDGLESTRKIRALGGKYKDLPIVALTANAFDDDRNACFDSGMNDFMTKPVSAEELQEMVLNWTKERQKMAS